MEYIAPKSSRFRKWFDDSLVPEGLCIVTEPVVLVRLDDLRVVPDFIDGVDVVPFISPSRMMLSRFDLDNDNSASPDDKAGLPSPESIARAFKEVQQWGWTHFYCFGYDINGKLMARGGNVRDQDHIERSWGVSMNKDE